MLLYCFTIEHGLYTGMHGTIIMPLINHQYVNICFYATMQNAMISSIVHVTNLPGKRVLKWFEDKRLEDGIPTQRVPYRRSSSESIFTN